MKTLIRIGMAIAAGLALLGACRSAKAGPPVMQDSRRLRTSSYDEAAAEAGVSDWGKTGVSTGNVHVTVRLEVQRLQMLITLPPSVPASKANAWFSGLADAMGWSAANLYAAAQPQVYVLRADVPADGLSQDGLRLHGEFHLDVLQQQLKTLVPLPALVVVRTVGEKEFSIDPKPDASTGSGGNQFHFYRLGPSTPPVSAVSIQSVIPVRRFAAAITGLLLWLLVPPLGCFILREQVRKMESLPAMDRLQLFRRWLRGITLGSLVGVMITFFTLGIPLIVYVPSRFAALFPMLMWFPLLGGSLVGRMIGLPLEREAWPQRRTLPWYRMLANELLGGAIVICIFVAISGVMVSGRGAGLAGVPFILLISMGMPVLVGVGFAVWGWMKWSKRKKGLSAGDVEAPPEVQAAVQELTTRLEAPVGRVVITPPVLTGGIQAMVVAVKDGTAVISSELAEALNPEQVAALVAAAALMQPRNPRQKVLQVAMTTGMFLPILVILPLSLLASTGSFRGFSNMMPLVMLVGPLTMIFSLLYTRRIRRIQEQADLRVVEATDQPRLLVDALKKQEEVTAASTGMDTRSAAVNQLLTQRRTRLQQRVGLD